MSPWFRGTRAFKLPQTIYNDEAASNRSWLSLPEKSLDCSRDGVKTCQRMVAKSDNSTNGQVI